MTVEMILLSVVIVLVLGLGGYLFYRQSQGSVQGGFKILQDSFESMQRQLLLQQKEFERTHDTKTSLLRGELGEALGSSRKELQQGLLQMGTSLETKVGAIDQRLENRLKEMNQGVQSRLDENVKEGFKHFEKVQQSLRQAELQLQSLSQVGQSITELNSLLKLPHLRGGFGEATLERILSDNLPADAFEMQYLITPGSTERVDAVIKCPQFLLPIDSKFPREQILPLFETDDPVKLEGARKTLFEMVRILARSIREKYVKPEHGTSDLALLFVPSETLYFELIRHGKIAEELSKNKVFAVSPNTLGVTVHAISIARSYYDMAKGVEKTLAEMGKTRQHLTNFERKFEDVGTALNKAQNAFGTAGTHLSRYKSGVSRLIGEASPESAGESAPPLTAGGSHPLELSS